MLRQRRAHTLRWEHTSSELFAHRWNCSHIRVCKNGHSCGFQPVLGCAAYCTRP